MDRERLEHMRGGRRASSARISWPFPVLLFAFCLLPCLLVGCAKPSVPVDQFIGTWIAAPEKEELKLGVYPTLTMQSDGSGILTQYPDPHPMNVSWMVRGDKLILSDRDGSGAILTYRYKFKDRDRLTVTWDKTDVVFRRYAVAQSKAVTPSPAGRAGRGMPARRGTGAVTRDGSARPPARSRR